MKKMVVMLVLLVILLLPATSMAGCSAGSASEAANRSVKERLIVRDLDLNYPMYPVNYVLSPDLRRIAYVLQKGNYHSVVIDGVAGKQYDKVENLAFSPDGKLVGYVATSGTRKIVVLEGKETATYDYVDIFNGLKFSPDGRHVAYLIHKLDVSGSGPDVWHAVVLDGVEGKHYPGIFYGPIFSPDSNHMTYSVDIGNSRGFVVTDGMEGKVYTSIMAPTWSADSQKLLYCAKDPATGKVIIVVNGVESKQYYSVWGTFSPDGKRVVLKVKEGNDSIIVIDGVESRYQGDITGPFYSPDGSRMVHQVKLKAGKAFMVIDGKEGEHYDSLGGYWFSQDSNHVAYTAMTNNRWFLVVDGVQDRELDRGSGVTFSPDWRRTAYVNRVGTGKDMKNVLVVDGTAGKPYASIGEIVFSPDSRRVVYVAHPDLSGQVVVENGVETQRYTWTESVGTGSSNNYPTIKPVFSPDSRHLAYIVAIFDFKLKSLKQVVIYDGKQGKEYDKINNLQFTSDSRHLIYTAYALKDKKDPRSQHWYVVIDGEEREYTMLLNGKVIFDSDNTLHYLVSRGKDIYLVEEKLN